MWTTCFKEKWAIVWVSGSQTHALWPHKPSQKRMCIAAGVVLSKASCVLSWSLDLMDIGQGRDIQYVLKGGVGLQKFVGRKALSQRKTF